MRLKSSDVVTDHAILVDVGADDHHPSIASARIVINSQTIGPGTYLLRVALGKAGCQTVRAVLRGTATVNLQGHEGCFVLGSAAQQSSCSIGIRPYPSGLQSYCGGYSRLHGDSHLSHNCFGQGAIRLDDVYIDGSDAVFSFFNVQPSARNLTVYGTVIAK